MSLFIIVGMLPDFHGGFKKKISLIIQTFKYHNPAGHQTKKAALP